MPGPFPGMDPYVERGNLWPELHGRLMVYACDALQPLLPANYVARLELRIYAEREPGEIRSPVRVPDLELVRTGAPGGGETAQPSRVAGAPEGYWIEAVPVERRETHLAIRTLGEGELITSVELLSPGNKRPGAGREKYLQKQAELLDAGVNLVEIDLLRGGLHTVAAPAERLQGLPPHHYRICIYRPARPWGFWLGPWTVRDPLPPVSIPLSPGDAELLLPLAALFERAYDNAACRKLIDYRGEPDPPLCPEDAAWAEAVLRQAGLRGDAGG